ncbi:hypothetical protein GRF29_1g2294713 [Pseudopithomyces chartarum]|uniref:Uncharacterized protein n=1 Tax=Pseudopithomyces chartarum TaxID=1892770 RepID=A0AAN6M9Y8_9PLEO|nr:hypothetical protein GRF29_1g2294713 [Pseudopithomyces chartarum]
MFVVRPIACAVFLAASVAAQETSLTEEPFMTIQTAIPTEIPTSISGTEGEFTSACLEVCVVEPCTQCPLTNPLATETPIATATPVTSIPQLSFCDGVYTNTPCITPSGVMSIPQGETPIPSSLLSSVVSSVAGESSDASSPAQTTMPPRSSSRGDSSVTRPIPTSSASGSVQEETPTSTPGAAPSIRRGDNFAWAAVAVSGLSATLGFAWALF